jgi:hypothetical protein
MGPGAAGVAYNLTSWGVEISLCSFKFLVFHFPVLSFAKDHPKAAQFTLSSGHCK